MSTSLASATSSSTTTDSTDSTKKEDMKSTKNVSTLIKQSSDDSPRRSSRPTLKPNYSITEIFDDVHFGQVESATPMTTPATATPAATSPNPAALSDKVMLQSSPKMDKQLATTTTLQPPLQPQLAGPSKETSLIRRKKTIFPAILPANSTNSRTIRLTVASQPVATLLPQQQQQQQQQQPKERKEKKRKSIDIIPMIIPSRDLTITTTTTTPTTPIPITPSTKTRKRKEKLEKKLKLNIQEMDLQEAKVNDASVFDGVAVVEDEEEEKECKLQIDNERPKCKRRRKKVIGDEMKDALYVTEQNEQNDETATTKCCPPVKERRIVYEGKCQHCSLGTSLREDTPLKEQRNPLICCDLCSLLFHIDCLPNPTIAAPSPGTPFTCPMHLDRYNLEQIYGSDADADAKIAIIQEKLTIPLPGSGMVSVAKIGIESWPDENLFIWPESAIRCQMSWKVRGHRDLVEDSGFGGFGVNNGNVDGGKGDINSNDSMDAAANAIPTTFTPPTSVFEHYKYIRGLSRCDVERIKYSETLRYRNQGCETGI